MKKCAQLHFFLAALLIMITTCESPVETAYTISGSVKNRITGQGLPNATVLIGGKSAYTDADGKFCFTYDSAQTITGSVYVYKGLDYSFWGVTEVSINTASNPVYSFNLQPLTSDGLSDRTISGTLPVTAGAGASLYMMVMNTGKGGGQYESEDINESDTTYTLDTYTYGPDCFITVYYDDDNLAYPIMQYYSHQDLSSDLVLDINDETGTIVTINGALNDTFTGDLALNPYVDIPTYVQGAISAGSSIDLEIYNPENFPIIWKNVLIQSNTPATDIETVRLNISSEVPFSSSVTLPVTPVSIAAPSDYVNPASIIWDNTSRTISFTGVIDADMYMLQFVDDMGHQGYIFVDITEIALPDLFYSYTIASGYNWDIIIKTISSTDTLNDYIDMVLGPNGPLEVTNTEISYVGDTANILDRTVDLIP